MKYIFSLWFVFIASFLYGQEVMIDNLNDFKYAVIKDQYDFQREANSHRINDLLEFLIEKKGLIVVYENGEQPNDLFANPCNAVKFDLVNLSNAFTFKMRMDLKDCKNVTIYQTPVVKSKQKAHSKGYPDVVRKAFVYISDLPYDYEAGDMEPENSLIGSYFRGDLELRIYEVDGQKYLELIGEGKKGLILDTDDLGGFQVKWENEKEYSILRITESGLELQTEYGYLEFLSASNQ